MQHFERLASRRADETRPTAVPKWIRPLLDMYSDLSSDEVTEEGARMLKLGVIGTSSKKNERRIPIHPDHFSRRVAVPPVWRAISSSSMPRDAP